MNCARSNAKGYFQLDATTRPGNLAKSGGATSSVFMAMKRVAIAECAVSRGLRVRRLHVLQVEGEHLRVGHFYRRVGKLHDRIHLVISGRIKNRNLRLCSDRLEESRDIRETRDSIFTTALLMWYKAVILSVSHFSPSSA